MNPLHFSAFKVTSKTGLDDPYGEAKDGTPMNNLATAFPDIADLVMEGYKQTVVFNTDSGSELEENLISELKGHGFHMVRDTEAGFHRKA